MYIFESFYNFIFCDISGIVPMLCEELFNGIASKQVSIFSLYFKRKSIWNSYPNKTILKLENLCMPKSINRHLLISYYITARVDIFSPPNVDYSPFFFAWDFDLWDWKAEKLAKRVTCAWLNWLKGKATNVQ